MYLYNKEGNKIEIYSFIPNYDKEKEFRESEKKLIPEDKKYIRLETNMSNYYLKKIINNKRNLILSEMIDNVNFTIKKGFKNHYSKMYFDKMIDPNNTIYIDGPRRNLINIYDYYDNDETMGNRDNVYALINGSYVKDSNDSNKYVLSGIVNLTKKLYLLEILKKGNFDLLTDNEIKEFLDLFDFSHVTDIDKRKLDEMIKYKIINYDECNISSKLEESQKILKLMK